MISQENPAVHILLATLLCFSMAVTDTASATANPGSCQVAGQVVSGRTRQGLADARVVIGGKRIPVDGKGRFLTEVPAGTEIRITVSAPEHQPFSRTFDLSGPYNFRQIRLASRWSLEGTALFGVQDFNSLHFHEKKLQAFLDDVQGFGNCTLIVLERSDRACDGGWWEQVKDGGYVPQFGDYARFPGDGPGFNSRAVEKLESYWAAARARDLHVITTLFNPYDAKHNGVWTAMHGAECGREKQLFRIPGNRKALERQKAFARLVATAAKKHPNVILSDNWEEGAPKVGVNLAWKQEIYRTVRRAGFTGTYIVYVGGRHGFDDREATLRWVRKEPDIAGVQVHYEYPSPGSLGLRDDQRVIHTEDHQLLLGPTPEQPKNRWIHQIFRHARSQSVECCYCVCDWRDFMRTDKRPDPLRGLREEARRRLERTQ